MLRKILVILGHIVARIVFVVFLISILGSVLMLLWNWLMPCIFTLPSINFLQACGLIVMSKILFACHPGHHNPKYPPKTLKCPSKHLKHKISKWLEKCDHPECKEG